MAPEGFCIYGIGHREVDAFALAIIRLTCMEVTGIENVVVETGI